MTKTRIGYVTVDSAADVRAWSGLNVHILQALRDAGLDMIVADDLIAPDLWLPSLKAKLWRRWFDASYALDRDPSIARWWSREAACRLAEQGDVRIVVSTGTGPIAHLPDKYATAIWSDATFHALRSTYPELGRISRSSIRSGDEIERRAYRRARLVCFASDWAAADAACYYGVPEQKIAVVPFGANCPPAYPDEAAAVAGIRARSRGRCHLLFVGVSWERKGGALVLETAQRLHDRGIPVRLSVVGCTPPAGLALPDWVECRGFLNKQVPADFECWDALLRTAHFLMVPSTAECYGLVYAEASAYAVPSIARDVGGVASVVKQGANGWLFPADGRAGAYAEFIERLWNDAPGHERLALTSYREWVERLNWGVAGKRFVQALAAKSLI